MASKGGHVFIAQGDLTQLACDAWLLPTDATLNVEQHWLKHAPGALRERDGRLTVSLPAGWSNEHLRVRKLQEWPGGRREPQPWLVNVGGGASTPAEWHADGVRQFIEAVAKDLREPREAARDRAHPLVALPLVGTGRGGAHKIKGDIVAAVLGVLHDAVANRDLDVVLVTNTAGAFAAAQAARRRRSNDAGTEDHRRYWHELDQNALDRAGKLAQEAARGSLVLFVGAGVSVAAGLPAWSELLKALAHDAALSDHELKILGELPATDQARLIEGRFPSRTALGKSIAAHLDSRYYSLAHALLAPLPVNEIVTTNYDRLFESAAKALGPGKAVAVLPYDHARTNTRWLLKLHGSIDPAGIEDIVLTREDYLRYSDRRAALAGIVQALLITRHMLFVGFSLTDENFHRIADDVRKAIRGTRTSAVRGEHFGTALLPFQGLTEELWKDDLHCVGMATPRGHPPAKEELLAAVRRIDIFLDCLLTEATSNAAHLLDQSYEHLLSADELEIRDALRVLDGVSVAAKSSPVWAPIKRLLQNLGQER